MDNRYSRFLLTAIAILLALLVFRQYEAPLPVHAQSEGVYVEPGYTTIRSPDGFSQFKGKIVVNLNNGEVWGFPTLGDRPYPADIASNKPPVSKPVFLGTFDLPAMRMGRR
jgi:hypothetical protein